VCPAWARCNRVKVPCIMNLYKIQILAYGNCDSVRDGGKEAYGKDMSPRTETSYKADSADELAPHSEVPGSALEVNGGVVYRNNAFLPGEVSLGGTGGFQSTRKAGASGAAMPRTEPSEESAESGVVVSESVSNRRRETRPVKDAASRYGRRLEPKKWNQPEVSDG